MRVVCISDTHNQHDKLDLGGGDVLIHAGDSTMNGTPEEFFAFRDWFVAQPHTHKIFIAGNHDFCLEDRDFIMKHVPYELIYLEDGCVTLEGVKFWGTPWCPNLRHWAFYGNRAKLLRAASLIDEDTDVLIAHSPPYRSTDRMVNGEYVGNTSLTQRLSDMDYPIETVICGHIHEGYGSRAIDKFRTMVYNVSVLDVHYDLRNRPVVITVGGD